MLINAAAASATSAASNSVQSPATAYADCQVFLSHSGHDKHAVLPLYFALRFLHGGSETCVFFDRASLKAMQTFSIDLVAALRSARVGVLWLTSNFFRSQWCRFEASILMMQAGQVHQPLSTYSNALRDMTKGQKEAAGVQGEWLVDWLRGLPEDAAFSAEHRVHPVYVEAGCQCAVEDISNKPLFRLPPDEYRKVLSGVSGATSGSDLTKAPLLEKIVHEIQHELHADEPLPNGYVKQLVQQSMEVSARVEAHATRPSLTNHYKELVKRMEAVSQSGEAAQSANAGRLDIRIGSSSTATANADLYKVKSTASAAGTRAALDAHGSMMSRPGDTSIKTKTSQGGSSSLSLFTAE